ncbi:MAG: glycoside hydrolase family 2 [Dysgonamonadaceae bacterium]|jgi:beta-galactosidase|nr:glycoside hydrolase family 2 [Dysgonamonadaceae bacterium]
MKKLLIIFAFIISGVLAKADDILYYDHVFAPSEGYICKVEKPLRKELCLNGQWDFQAIELPADYRQGKGMAPVLLPPDEGKWDKVKIKIPSPWNINSFANRNLEGPDHRNYPSYPEAWEKVKMAWMKKRLTIPANWSDHKIILHFEAVAGQTEVYVNGNKVVENFDLFLPFEADITPFVQAGAPVEIRVGVRSQSLFEDNSTKGRRIVPAGSMWGYHVNGIWQDVYLIAIPKININNVYIKPLVSKNCLELDLTVENSTDKETALVLNGDIREWINKAGTDVHSAPVPRWELAKSAALNIPDQKLTVKPGMNQVTIRIPVKEGDLAYWTPEFPNLYGITLSLNTENNKAPLKAFKGDIKYERFGWREWTFDGSKQLLNGKAYQLKGDSWHFMGVPQLTRRYAWAWFTALKDANANAVRPHAQVYPRFYFDVADEMGICILAETANWASDGGPKMDSPLFWEHSKDHLKRMILRDRNHPAVFGWSISNENKPVILHVFNKPEWMEQQKQAWIDWRDIVRTYDSTRPWISSDGEDDGDGILPTTVGHYGDKNSMKHWIEIGKPWGIGEHSMAYYGTPEQVSKYNGERAYESQLGRMEGLAYECYDLIAQQRLNGASYVSVFNIAWYALQPLPFGKKDLTTSPNLNDGIHFKEYKEGVPGIQPERMGPYCSTFNPGYDPCLPLYKTWPMFDAIKAANAGNAPAWSKWAQMPEKPGKSTLKNKPERGYSEITFIGNTDGQLKQVFENHGVTFVNKIKQIANSLLLLDGKYLPSAKEITLIKGYLDKGADIWIWSPTPESSAIYNAFLPGELVLEERKASSFLPLKKSWLKNTVNSDFYFSEIQTNEVSLWGMSGDFVQEGEVLLEACRTDWRKWNKRPEELKTASVLRSEYEAKGSGAVFVKYPDRRSVFYVSTLDDFTSTEKGYTTLDKILFDAGIPAEGKKLSEWLIDEQGYVNLTNLFTNKQNDRNNYRFWLWSPRPLDDLLIEPDMPELDIVPAEGNEEIILNGTCLTSYQAVPLKQGWNQIVVSVSNTSTMSNIRLVCGNNAAFVSQLKTSLYKPD